MRAVVAFSPLVPALSENFADVDVVIEEFVERNLHAIATNPMRDPAVATVEVPVRTTPP